MTKEEERHEAYKRTVALVVAVVVMILSFLIIRPFLVAILSAAALSYIFYPFYLTTLKYLPKKARVKEIGAIFTCLVIILIVLVPVSFVTTFLSYEIRDGYLFLQEFFKSNQPLQNLPPFLSQWAGYLPQFKEIATELGTQALGLIQGVLKGIPNVILSIFITIFSIYYFLKHGKDLYNFFSDLFPLPEGRYRQMIARFDDLSRGMIMGQVAVGRFLFSRRAEPRSVGFCHRDHFDHSAVRSGARLGPHHGIFINTRDNNGGILAADNTARLRDFCHQFN